MTRKCFNEEVKASNKNCKVNGSALCFFYNIFFLFLWGKVGGSEKNRLLSGVENGLADVTGTVRNDYHLPEHKLRVLFATGSVASSTTLCWNSRLVSTSSWCRNLSFCISLGSAVTFFRWSGQIYNQLVSSFFSSGTFYISLQIALNDFVITEVQLHLKPSNSRTHIEPNRTENIRNPNWTQIFCTCEDLEPNRTLTFVRTRTEPNPSSEGSFPSLVLIS